MEILRKSLGGWIVGTLVLFTGLMFVSGCGGDSTKPEPEVKAMGGILVARGMPPGTPYQAGVVVTVDGQVVTDAEVSINGANLTYVENPSQPETTGYVGVVQASAGSVLTLSVTAAGQTRTLQATIPGMVAIQAPLRGTIFDDDADIPVSWTPSTGATMSIVTCAGAASTASGMWLLAGNASTYAIPAEATVSPGCRITVLGINGSGDLPTSFDLRGWAGKNGFWVSCQDFVDVLINR